jgi:hypothetical protein
MKLVETMGGLEAEAPTARMATVYSPDGTAM